jgi:hypothetical protein
VGLGRKAFLLVRPWRALGAGGVLAESTDHEHLVDSLHRVCVAPAHTMAVRLDGHRLPPASAWVNLSFAQTAKHYAVSVALCPPRRGNRKGVVEKSNHIGAQRWWRTVADEGLLTQRAQPVLAAAGQLAGHRQRGAFAIQPGLGPAVVVVVR